MFRIGYSLTTAHAVLIAGIVISLAIHMGLQRQASVMALKGKEAPAVHICIHDEKGKRLQRNDPLVYACLARLAKKAR